MIIIDRIVAIACAKPGGIMQELLQLSIDNMMSVAARTERIGFSAPAYGRTDGGNLLKHNYAVTGGIARPRVR